MFNFWLHLHLVASGNTDGIGPETYVSIVVDGDSSVAAGIPPIPYRPLDRCSQIDACSRVQKRAHPFPWSVSHVRIKRARRYAGLHAAADSQVVLPFDQDAVLQIDLQLLERFGGPSRPAGNRQQHTCCKLKVHARSHNRPPSPYSFLAFCFPCFLSVLSLPMHLLFSISPPTSGRSDCDM
jgi:hypothetical protein